MNFAFRCDPCGTREKLRIFFSGWGMGPECELLASGCDLLLVSDYTTLEPLPELSEYREIEVIAWSLGVYHAAELLMQSPGLPVTRAIAVNGTLEPMSDAYGIPPAIFMGTLDRWDGVSRLKFNRRMFSDPAHAAEFGTLPMRSVEEQKLELASIAARLMTRSRAENCFDTAVIGTMDRIFPEKAQEQAWQREAPVAIVRRDYGHDFRPHYGSFDDFILEVSRG